MGLDPEEDASHAARKPARVSLSGPYAQQRANVTPLLWGTLFLSLPLTFFDRLDFACRTYGRCERIEQGNRYVEAGVNMMHHHFKRFRSAATTILGIELMHRIREVQFNRSKPGIRDTRAAAVWNAVLFER